MLVNLWICETWNWILCLHLVNHCVFSREGGKVLKNSKPSTTFRMHSRGNWYAHWSRHNKKLIRFVMHVVSHVSKSDRISGTEMGFFQALMCPRCVSGRGFRTIRPAKKNRQTSLQLKRTTSSPHCDVQKEKGGCWTGWLCCISIHVKNRVFQKPSWNSSSWQLASVFRAGFAGQFVWKLYFYRNSRRAAGEKSPKLDKFYQ
jgi:hypothetical protein